MLVRVRSFSGVFTSFALVATMFVMPKEVNSQTMPLSTMKPHALADLKELLHTQAEWVKVHVAEFLIWENRDVDDVRTVFLQEERKFGEQPRYRIGIWRVLAQAAKTPEERKRWTDRIRAVYDDPACTDRLHAIETLAKLGIPVEAHRDWVAGIQADRVDAFTVYKLWNAAYHPDIGPNVVRDTCLSLLRQLNGQGKLEFVPTLSYVLRYLKPFTQRDWAQLPKLDQILKMPVAMRANLLATAWMTAPTAGDQQVSLIKNQLLSMDDVPAGLQQLLHGLAERGEADDQEALFRLYQKVSDVDRTTYDPDIHATAAYAVLKVTGRFAKEEADGQ